MEDWAGWERKMGKTIDWVGIRWYSGKVRTELWIREFKVRETQRWSIMRGGSKGGKRNDIEMEGQGPIEKQLHHG
jgi:hypothetical protein